MAGRAARQHTTARERNVPALRDQARVGVEKKNMRTELVYSCSLSSRLRLLGYRLFLEFLLACVSLFLAAPASRQGKEGIPPLLPALCVRGRQIFAENPIIGVFEYMPLNALGIHDVVIEIG